jgi:hypothetical protein
VVPDGPADDRFLFLSDVLRRHGKQCSTRTCPRAGRWRCSGSARSGRCVAGSPSNWMSRR